MAKKVRTSQESSSDQAAVQMLDRAVFLDIDTAFRRADNIIPCNIGSQGLCCKHCAAGPCRLVGNTLRGVCGATADTIVARNFTRSVAAGSAAHSDHARGLAYTLLAATEGDAPDFRIRDPYKLKEVAGYLSIKTDGRTTVEIAKDVALAALGEFGKPQGELTYLKRAPAKRQQIWKENHIAPRNIDREVVETLHRTNIGNDQDPEHILDQAMRCALSDGWGGSMLGTDLTDVLFGTPAPVLAEANLGVLEADMVNLVVHGHEPTLSEMIVAAVQDPELIAYAQSKGAKGINLAGLCCTANEALLRQGIKLAGNFLQQELALITGAVDAMVVDVQCIMEGLNPGRRPLPYGAHQHLAEGRHPRLNAHRIRRAPRAGDGQGDRACGHRSLRPARRDYDPRCQEPGRPRLLARVHRLCPGWCLPGFLPPAERCHYAGPHPRRGSQHWL